MEEFIFTNEKSKEIFKDSYELVMMYYNYLHLGFFYHFLSQDEDLSIKSKDIRMKLATDTFFLKKEISQSLLKNKYNDTISRQGKSEDKYKTDPFSSLIFNNSIRGVAMALFETLKDKEIKQLFLNHIFENNQENFDSFDGVLRFIRNTFSHNIREEIKLKKEDYSGQIQYLWENQKKTTINFSFDYSKYPFFIKDKENYFKKINIDFNKIEDDVSYKDIVPEYETMLFIELCHNCMWFLENKFSIIEK